MCGNFIRFILPLMFLVMILGTTVVASATEESIPNETKYKILEKRGVPNDYLEGLPETTLDNLYDDIVIKKMQFTFQKESKIVSLPQDTRQRGHIPEEKLKLFMTTGIFYKPNSDQIEKIYVGSSSIWQDQNPNIRREDAVAINWDGNSFLLDQNAYAQEDFYVTWDDNRVTQTRRTLPSQSNDGGIGYHSDLAYSYASPTLQASIVRIGSKCSFELIPRSPIFRTSIEKVFPLHINYVHNTNPLPVSLSFSYAGLGISVSDSAMSDTLAMASTINIRKLSSVKNIKLTSSTNRSVTLSWDPVPTATQYNVKLTKYDGVPSGEDFTKSTNTRIEGFLEPNTKYLVEIIPHDNYHNSGDPSRITVSTQLQKPVAAVASKTDKKVTLNWNAVESAKKYSISYSDNGIDYHNLSTVTGTTYAHNNLMSDQKYSYKVVAIDEEELASEAGVISAVTLPGKADIESVTGVKGGINLNFPMTVGFKSITREIYRSTSSTGTYSKIATTILGIYQDTKATKGKRFYYKVRAIGEGGVGAFSSVKSAIAQ